MSGHRAIHHEGWLASAQHGGVPWTVGLPGEPESQAPQLLRLRADLAVDGPDVYGVIATPPAIFSIDETLGTLDIGSTTGSVGR